MLDWQPPPLALALPHVHSLVLGNRACWQALPAAIRLGCLEDLDLQVLIASAFGTTVLTAFVTRQLVTST